MGIWKASLGSALHSTHESLLQILKLSLKTLLEDLGGSRIFWLALLITYNILLINSDSHHDKELWLQWRPECGQLERPEVEGKHDSKALETVRHFFLTNQEEEC